MDIEPVQPAGSTSWAKLVRRRSPDEDEHGRQHAQHEDEADPDEAVQEDEDGQAHIDVRV